MPKVLSEKKKKSCLNCGRKILIDCHKMDNGNSLCDGCYAQLRIDKEYTKEIFKASNRAQILNRLKKIEDLHGISFIPWFSNLDSLTIEQAQSLGFDKTFNVTEQFGSLIFNDVNGMFAKGRGGNWDFIYYDEEYLYKDILNFELHIDGYIEMKGGVGMALVGGLLLGTVGAIAGASSWKASSKINNISIKIVTKNETLFFPILREVVEKGTIRYKQVFNEAHKAMGKLQQIADIQQSLDTKTNLSDKTTIADELIKLQTLLDNGIISEQELMKAKERLFDGTTSNRNDKDC